MQKPTKLSEYPVPSSFVLGNAPFINTWLITDPISNSSPATMDQHPEAIQACQPAPKRAFGSSKWYVFDDRVFSRNYDDYVDLFSYFRAKRNLPVAGAAIYAAVWLWSPSATAAQVRIGADNMFRAWWNGLPIGSADHANTTGDPNPPAPGGWPNSYYCVKSDNAGKDMSQLAVQMKQGWNLLMLKVGNKEEGLFGFYARICQPDGNAIPGLVPSLAGPDQPLQTALADMPGVAPDLPVAFTEWPYVHTNHPLIAEALSIWPEGHQMWAHAAQSSEFRLSAAGGLPPYHWKLTAGRLPKGMKLNDDGIITGPVDMKQPLGTFPLAFRVTDSTGKTATARTMITVKERPNRRYETARLNALIHAPDKYNPPDWPKLARIMKDQGYTYGMPIGYGNGDWYFRFRNRFDPNAPTAGAHDLVKKALEAEGLKYGIYLGNMHDSPQFKYEQVILMIEDACKQYKPAAFWLDWLAIDQSSLDAIYSMVRTMLPDTLMIVNGVERPTHGDWDICCVEEFSFVPDQRWGRWPNDVKASAMEILKSWPKMHMMESWRPMLWPWKGDVETVPEWQDYQRVAISLIGEGNIADMDHSPGTGAFPGVTGGGGVTFDSSKLMTAHNHMADWASKDRTEPLYHAYTNIVNTTLPDQPWGYTTQSLDGRYLYLLTLKNPRGKTGLPKAGLELHGLKNKIRAAVCMNDDQQLSFKQSNSGLKIDTSAITEDPICTIIKLTMVTSLPLPERKMQEPVFHDRIPSEGNLAKAKPARLLSVDGTRDLTPNMEVCYASLAVDGLSGTAAVGSGDWAWALEVDLLKPETVGHVKVLFAAGWATSYKIGLSEDRVQWKTVATGAGAKNAWREHRFAAIKARYVRITAIKPDGENQEGTQMGIVDLQVYPK